MADEGRWLNEIGNKLGIHEDAAQTKIPDTWECPTHGSYSSKSDDGCAMQWNCPTCEAVARTAEGAWRQAWLFNDRFKRSGLPLRHRTRTLDNFRPRSPADGKVLAAVRSWIAQLGKGDLGALVLLGAVGLGKTHLAAGIVASLIPDGVSCVYWSVPDLLAAIKASFDDDSETSAEKVLAPLNRADLVVLDEVAATRGTEWEQLQLSSLIDDRYRDGGAIVICSNATREELPRWIGERAADRLDEFGLVLTLAGRSYRSQAPTDDVLRNATSAIPEPEAELRLSLTARGVHGTRTLFKDEDGRISAKWKPS